MEEVMNKLYLGLIAGLVAAASAYAADDPVVIGEVTYGGCSETPLKLTSLLKGLALPHGSHQLKHERRCVLTNRYRSANAPQQLSPSPTTERYYQTLKMTTLVDQLHLPLHRKQNQQHQELVL